MSILSRKRDCGKALKFRKVGHPTRTVIVPAGRKEIPRGTFNSILRQAHLVEKNFK